MKFYIICGNFECKFVKMGVVCPGKFNNIIEPTKVHTTSSNNNKPPKFKKNKQCYIKNGKTNNYKNIPRIELLNMYETRKYVQNFVMKKKLIGGFTLKSDRKSKSISDLANQALEQTKGKKRRM